MTQADERVLEFLNEKEIEASPSVIAANIDYNPSYISRRCKKLLDTELLRHTDARNYKITVTGKDYLHDRLSVEEIEELEKAESDGDEGVTA